MEALLKNYNSLDLTNYIPSLLKESAAKGLITNEELNFIETQFISLLYKRVEKFTLKESSSLPVEKAQDILDSIMYTVGIELQREESIEKQIELLCSFTINKLYEN